jgi:hypothetical protein
LFHFFGVEVVGLLCGLWVIGFILVTFMIGLAPFQFFGFLVGVGGFWGSGFGLYL